MPPNDMAGASSCNIVCASLQEADFDILPLTNSEQEMKVLATQTKAPLVARTWSIQSYLK